MLENDARVDSVFTGGNYTVDQRLCKSAQQRVVRKQVTHKFSGEDGQKVILGLDKIKKKRGGIVKKKDQIHADVDQETQLVNIENKNTLSGKINLLKIRDIRRAIRRRYATRKNPQKIFQTWDHKKQGILDSEDLARMINKLGININQDEAHVLLTSADENSDGGLDLKEFHNLIFDSNDALNVDLSKIPVNAKDETAQKLMKSLKESTVRRSQEKIVDQLKMFTQKNLNNIAKDLLNIDEDRKYKVEKEEFERVLRYRINLPESLKQDPQILTSFIDRYSDDDKVNYQQFMEELRGFQFKSDVPEGAHSISGTALPSYSSATVEPDYNSHISRNNFVVLDSRKVPQNQLDAIEKRTLAVHRHLRKKFPKAKEFNNKLSGLVKIEKRGTIDVNQLRDAIVEICDDELTEQKLVKRDIEAFLSSYLFNQHGHTKYNDIVPKIYKTHLDHAKVVRAQPPPELSNIDVAHIGETVDKRGVKKLCEKLVEKLITTERKSHYTMFKQFDMDGDGYISYTDFVKKINAMELGAPKEDALKLAKLFDPDKNGYIEFKDFSKKMTPNLPNLFGTKEEEVKDNADWGGAIAPNLQNIRRNDTLRKAAAKTYREIDRKLRPDEDARLTYNSRFGATPNWKNTFSNISHPPKSAGFVSEVQRFSRGGSSVGVKCEFQNLEKQRKQRADEGRIHRRRERMKTIESQAVQNDINRDIFDQQKILKSAGVMQRYERVCHRG